MSGPAGPDDSPRATFRRYLEAIQARDLAALRSLAHPEFQDFYPQSGEVTVGVENLIRILTDYPGGIEQLGHDRVIGGEEQFVRTPIFTFVRVDGSGNDVTGLSRARYPDGTSWYIVVIGVIRDGLVFRTETYWAPYFEPAPWRAPFVELRRRPEALAEESDF